MWMEKYEKGMEEKQQEISTLRNARASNLLQLQELARKASAPGPTGLPAPLPPQRSEQAAAVFQYQHHERVVKEDRVQKLLLRQQLEMERNQRSAAVKVRRRWGPLWSCIHVPMPFP